MNNMKLLLTNFLFFMFLLSHCTLKTQVEPKALDYSNLVKKEALMPPSAYYNFLSQKASAYFLVSYQSKNIPTGSPAAGGYDIGGYISSETGKVDFFNNGSVKLNNIELPFTQNSNYYQRDASFSEQFYGKIVKFEIPTTGKGIFVDSIYVPERIQMISPVLKPSGGKTCISTEEDLALEWEPDTKNYNGVLIVVSFQRDKNDPADINTFAYVQSIPDNGKFVLPKSAFDGVPEDRRKSGEGTTINLLRASFKSTIFDAKQAVKISGYNIVRIDL
ncbi:MAG: hypothetical protein EAZ44_01435 [Cytophagia bacterium]|nr:MAG: hypothetical protein EAZ44_01435 [Cytophagia bacterium]TAG43495.1 MAG: hypothetical protein EAZ31_04075 [Cytophagia bacterium]TAH29791.1 MAG: hypothetical protein EAZ06_05555 [Cytophagales bacterium]